ncbi:hypothetical protein PTSG_02882 [Salpingoeca rosetta]|uniref:Uncharacterized protein n=1 Tax=Salpingoeca rosetta (strain ATCC 50818 / BSB-021) TaxID=946362 RepID=F2U3L7_SALR5|nr:uncharacterized protein PTSG_02882 [Salpingoeca rosetta]EGD82211.1 hypothetical protein PTSG_02882 [Salpingoeca rosetta]|eukprot:XP_004996394.1 hypothetical protein PTSG_02882 [Salpingoeca rosetta]
MDRDRVRLAVYQYLVEQGFDVAAMAMQDAMEDASAVREATEEASGQLLSMLDELVTLRETVNPTRKPKPALETAAIQPDNRFCAVEYACLQGRHEGNVLACRLSTDGKLITSSADRTVGVTPVDGLPEAVFADEPTAKFPMPCPILCVDYNPTNNLMLVGGMDGATNVLDMEGNVVQAGPKHRKYVVRVRWSPCGQYFATASYDGTAELWARGTSTRSKGDDGGSGNGDNSGEEYERLQQFHFEGNVECVTFAPPLDTAADTGGDDEPTAKFPMPCPILCVDYNPTNNLMLVGGMDGATNVLDMEGNVVQAGPKHRKYVVRVRWSPCGQYFATASYDGTAELWARGTSTRSKGDDGGSGNGDNSGEEYERLQQFHFEGNVECVTFAPPLDTAADTGGDGDDNNSDDGDDDGDDGDDNNGSGGDDGKEGRPGQLLICARGECCLHVYDIACKQTDYINMNELLDDYVSFSAMDACVSPDGRYVLVATDRDRLILLSRQHKCLLKVFYGASNGQYSNPRCCFHPSGAYVYASSEANDVVVWETTTQKVVQRLKGHSKVIRDMHMCSAHEMLVTCSYDKSVRFWGVE